MGGAKLNINATNGFMPHILLLFCISTVYPAFCDTRTFSSPLAYGSK